MYVMIYKKYQTHKNRHTAANYCKRRPVNMHARPASRERRGGVETKVGVAHCDGDTGGRGRKHGAGQRPELCGQPHPRLRGRQHGLRHEGHVDHTLQLVLLHGRHKLLRDLLRHAPLSLDRAGPQVGRHHRTLMLHQRPAWEGGRGALNRYETPLTFATPCSARTK